MWIFLYLIYYLIFVLSILLIYDMLIRNEKRKYAYFLELKNENPKLLVQSKIKVLGIKKECIALCKAENGEYYLCVLDDEKNINITTIFYNEKTGKYFNKKRSRKDIPIKASIETLDDIDFAYTGKFEHRGYVFHKEIPNMIEEKEIVMYRDVFENNYFFEDELNSNEIITEVDLVKRVPKELDKYFFEHKSLEELIKSQDKTVAKIVKPTLIGCAILVALLLFIRMM